MNLEDYPTPETDAHWAPVEGSLYAPNHPAKLKMQNLERRLAFARDTLRRVQNGYMRDAQRNLLIDTAIRETRPPVVDSSEAGATKGNDSEEKGKETTGTKERG